MPAAPVNDVFLRGVWSALIPSDVDTSWVERVASLDPDDGPLGDYGQLVQKMLDAGLSSGEIARFARIVGYEVAHGLCYHLSDPNASYEGFGDVDEAVDWGLFEIDPDTEAPVRPIWGLHEEILGADPSGTEMRPPQV